MGLRSIIERRIRKSRLTLIQKELERIAELPRFTADFAHIFHKPFKFHDPDSFIDTYKEIFVHHIYNFKPSANKTIILDCGANMGLSVLYFAQQYPGHTIMAFEPDAAVFEILKENVAAFDLKNVQLFDKAVWTKEEVLEFYTDKGMGGRVLDSYSNQEPTKIAAIRLADFLSAEVDFLKIDIEGAEYAVLKDCKPKLSEVGSVFFEYHNDINKDQTLHQLLEILKEEGFHYYIKESSVRKSPFRDTNLICESFDMAINVFAYKD